MRIPSNHYIFVTIQNDRMTAHLALIIGRVEMATVFLFPKYVMEILTVSMAMMN